MNTDSRKTMDRTAKMGRMALTLGGVAVGSLAMEAEGAVIYSGTLDISIAKGDGQSFNLDGDIYNDLLLTNSYYALTGALEQYVFLFHGDQRVVGTGGFVSHLAPGTMIDGSSPQASDFGDFYLSLNPAESEFTNVTNAYFGFRFLSGDTITGQYHYGWMRVDVDSTNGTMLVHDWAYESAPGVGIEAGSTVPEPSSLALLTMGSAAGIAAMRRRRAA